MLEKTLESPLDCKEIQPVHYKGDQPWVLKLKLRYFGHLLWRVDSLEKTLMLGGIGSRRRRGWQRMRWLDGITDSMHIEFEWIPGVGDGQGGLACCDSWGRKEWDTTERLIWSVWYIWSLSFETSSHLSPHPHPTPFRSLIGNISCSRLMSSEWARSDQIRSVTQSCLTLCDPMNRSTPGLPKHY